MVAINRPIVAHCVNFKRPADWFAQSFQSIFSRSTNLYYNPCSIERYTICNVKIRWLVQSAVGTQPPIGDRDQSTNSSSFHRLGSLSHSNQFYYPLCTSFSPICKSFFTQKYHCYETYSYRRRRRISPKFSTFNYIHVGKHCDNLTSDYIHECRWTARRSLIVDHTGPYVVLTRPNPGRQVRQGYRHIVGIWGEGVGVLSTPFVPFDPGV